MNIAVFGRLTLVGLSVCPSVRPSVTNFSEDRINSFFLILYVMVAEYDI